MLESGSGRPADDDQSDVAGQVSQRLDRDVRSFVRLESAGEEHETLLRINAEPIPDGGTVSGNEHSMVHTRMDDVDALGVRRIQCDKLIAFPCAARDDSSSTRRAVLPSHSYFPSSPRKRGPMLIFSQGQNGSPLSRG